MNKGLPDLGGRTAVITGAAKGIGRALARQLAAKGARLALVDVDGPGLSALADELDGELSVHRADVSDRERMRALPAEVAAEHGAIHLLVNNAGLAYEAAFPTTSLETWDRMVGVNFWGVVYGCHFFLPWLAKADRAHVVNLSSLFGYVGMPGQTAYCATKYAVRGLSECLWEELRPTRVGLTVVHPGGVATEIMKAAGGEDPELMSYLADWYERHALPPERAATRIVRAVERGTPRLLITPEARFADLARRLAPVLGNRAVTALVLRVLKLEHMRQVRLEQWQRTMVEGEPER